MPCQYLTTDSTYRGWNLRLVTAVFLAVLTLGCKESRVESRRGTFPVESIEIFGDSQSIRLCPEVSLTQVINLDLFQPFWPGITAEEAFDIAGEPTRKAMNSIVPPDGRRGDFYYYDRENAEVRISRIISGSGGMSDMVSWNLFLFPKMNSGGRLLSREITELIDPRIRELLVDASSESVEVVLKNGRVRYIVWHRNPPRASANR